MHKVLIVDDELLARNYLRSLIDWETNGFFICGEAENGTAASAQIDELSPDIVIVDIHMPGKNGVQLCTELARQHPHIQTIVLSSYDDYDYVRETMKSGTLDYLLKHRLNPGLLLQTLDRASRLLRERMQRSEIDNRHQADWERMKLASIERELMLWFKGHTGYSPSLKQDLNDFFMPPAAGDASHFAYVAAALQVKNFILLTGTKSGPDMDKLLRDLANLCRQSISNMAKGLTVYVDRGIFALIFAFYDVRSELQIRSTVEQILKRMQNAVRMGTNLHSLIGYSDIHCKMDELGAGFRAACRSLEHQAGILSPVPALVHMKTQEPADHALTLQDEQELIAAVEQRSDWKVEQLIRRIFERLANVGDSIAIHEVIRELIELEGKIRRKCGRTPELMNRSDAWDEETLQHDMDLGELEEWVKRLYLRLFDFTEDAEEEGEYSVYVRDAIHYLAHHYQHNISLEDAAGYAGISPSYLSRIFHEETGVSFVEKLNRIRIQKAKQLMDGGQIKIKEIYEKVGFTNYTYFFKVFKQNMKVTPRTYLKRIQHH